MVAYRIPVQVEGAGPAVIEDIDLAFLIQHSGGTGRESMTALRCRDGKGREVPVQWLGSRDPSVVSGQWRGSIMIARESKAPAREELTLFVEEVAAQQPEAKNHAVQLRQGQDAVEVAIDGKPFVTYRFNTKSPELPRPYFHPLIGPSGQTITQLGEVPGKREKHFHHTALWIAHQNFQAKGEPACDNWQIGRPNSSKIDHVRFDSVQGGPLAGRFIERLRWLNVKGNRTLIEETRTVTFPRLPPERRVIDFDLRLRAHELPVTFNRTPYHLLAVRVLDALLPGKGGVITNSAGTENPPDAAVAQWIDISGRLGDAWQGVALFNHPRNFRHPTPCLQFARQTIGLSPTHAQPFTLEPKEELRLRYRVYVHAGNVKEARVEAEYQAYIKQPLTRLGGAERVAG